MSELIQQLRRSLKIYQSVDLWQDNRGYKADAAVLIGVTDEAQPKIILTKRAEHLSTHKGEVAFPGGRIDPEDESVIHAALRESHEEVALPPEAVEVLGQLDPMITRFGMKVTPVVGMLSAEVPLIANPDELDAVFKVPLDFFLADERHRTDEGMLGEYKVKVPCWMYDGYEIWGVTAVILTQMMNQLFDRGIETGMEEMAQAVKNKSQGEFQPMDWRAIRK